MADDLSNNRTEIIHSITEALKRYVEAVPEHASAQDVAREWVEAGFDESEEVDGWLRARCFKAGHARKLEMAGITPEQAAIRTKAGEADYEDTIGYKVGNNDLSINEARRIITSEFWK